jgi:hypothetical protein
VKRNRAFLRALVHHDSETRREEVLEKQVEFEHGNPGTKFYTLFDYRVPIDINPLTEQEDTLEVVQMCKSQGSMQSDTKHQEALGACPPGIKAREKKCRSGPKLAAVWPMGGSWWGR